MSVYINKDELLKEFDIEQSAMELHGQEFCSSFLNAAREISTEWWYVENIVDYMPTVEIIRCKDCKHADEYNHCSLVTWWNKADDFCSMAEQRQL